MVDFNSLYPGPPSKGWWQNNSYYIKTVIGMQQRYP